jgi:hypothetical protein
MIAAALEVPQLLQELQAVALDRNNVDDIAYGEITDLDHVSSGRRYSPDPPRGRACAGWVPSRAASLAVSAITDAPYQPLLEGCRGIKWSLRLAAACCSWVEPKRSSRSLEMIAWNTSSAFPMTRSPGLARFSGLAERLLRPRPRSVSSSRSCFRSRTPGPSPFSSRNSPTRGRPKGTPIAT